MRFKRQLNNKVYCKNNEEIFILGGSFEYNFEILNTKDKFIDFRPDYTYDSVIKNDLNNFSSF